MELASLSPLARCRGNAASERAKASALQDQVVREKETTKLFSELSERLRLDISANQTAMRDMCESCALCPRAYRQFKLMMTGSGRLTKCQRCLKFS